MNDNVSGSDAAAHLTAKEARSYRARWERVQAIERRELRQMSLHEKLRQLAALMASVDALGWNEALRAEEAAVRVRWNRLRKAHGGQA